MGGVNVVILRRTLNFNFGSKLMTESGIVLNNQLLDFNLDDSSAVSHHALV